MKNIEKWFWVDREPGGSLSYRRRGLWAVNRKGKKKFIKGRCLHANDDGQNVLNLTGGDLDVVPYVVQYKVSRRGIYRVDIDENESNFAKLYLYGEPDSGCVNVCFFDKRFHGKRVDRSVFYIKGRGNKNGT